MEQYHLKDMTKGWLIGDFDPAAVHTKDFEFAVKYYQAGDEEAWHYHKAAKELTVIISGTVEMCGQTFGPGDIVVLNPGEGTAFRALTQAVTACVKIPSVAGDKFTR